MVAYGNAEKQLREMLALINMPERKSYRRDEICRILGIKERSFFRMIRKADCRAPGKQLKTFIKGNERRVSFMELAAYIERNNTYVSKIGNGFTQAQE